MWRSDISSGPGYSVRPFPSKAWFVSCSSHFSKFASSANATEGEAPPLSSLSPLGSEMDTSGGTGSNASTSTIVLIGGSTPPSKGKAKDSTGSATPSVSGDFGEAFHTAQVRMLIY